MNKQTYECSTEDRILDAALDLIQEKTISGLRLRQVAENAHVFQSNIHYYYNSKKNLLLAVQKKVLGRYRQIRQAHMDRFDPSKELSLEEALDVFIDQKLITILEEARYDIAELDFWNQCRMEPDMLEEFCRSYESWRQDIRDIILCFAPHMDSHKQRLLSGIIVSLLEGAAVQYLVDPNAFDLPAYFQYCKDILIKEIKG